MKVISMEKYFKKGNFCFILLFLLGCNRAAEISKRDLYFDDHQIQEEVSEKDIASIQEVLFSFLNILHQNKPLNLLELISIEDGIYVDLKAHLSYADFKKQLMDETSYVFQLFFTGNSEGDIATKSIREILQNRDIVYDVFFYSKAECEIYLETVDGERIFELTPPILRKKQGRWFMARSF